MVGAVLARDKAGLGSLWIASSLIAGKHRSHIRSASALENVVSGHLHSLFTEALQTPDRS